MPAHKWLQAPDTELLDACREGETDAFSMVWERHRRAAFAAARGIAPTLDADDLVSEAYLRIFELTVDGRGPRGAFRPYLYQVIRSVAVDRLRSPEQASDELDQIPDLHEIGPWEDNAFDKNAVTAAFSTLNERWQAALWYIEVEGMPPREASKLLGISANSVSALAVRARDALKSAWVEAHVNQQLTDAACQTTRRDLQRYQRGKLTSRATREVDAHLSSCATCTSIATEFSTLNRQLGLTLATAFFGSAGAAALLGQLGASLPSQDAAVAARVPDEGGRAGSSGTAGGSSGSAVTTAAGLGTTLAVASGVVVAAVALLGGAALLISSFVLPAEADAPAPIEQVDAGPAQEPDPESEYATDSRDAGEETSSNDVVGVPGVSGGGTVPHAPLQPITPLSPPTAPSPTTPPLSDQSDSTIHTGYTCTYPGLGFEGTANEYGVIRLRVIPNGGTAVEIVQAMYDPALVGQPGNLFTDVGGQPLFNDGRGNTFDFGFFSGTNPDSGSEPLGWWGPDLESMPEWAAQLPGVTLDDANVELRLVAPDGRFSPWMRIDTSVTCP